MCYKPGGSLGQSTYLIVNGEQVGETIELEEGNDTFKYLVVDQTWKYEMSVSKGKSYQIAASNDVALSQLMQDLI